MYHKMAWPLALAAIASPAAAAAQQVELTPLAEARLRYEAVDQAGLTKDADAVTVRVRGGLQAARGPWTATVEAQGNLAVNGNYYDGVNGAPIRPLVSDPQNVGLYVGQLQYKTKDIALTAGRQVIALDDERFVGPSGFRQNNQTFDAIRAQVTAIANLKIDLTYAWNVNTIWGIDGNGAHPQSIGGNNVLANVRYTTPIGTLSGFMYLVDQDEAAVQGFALSSQTYGGRLVGERKLSKALKFSYQLSYATQSNYHRNPNHYHADYYLIDGGLHIYALRIGGGLEVLGADKGQALTSFQTPLATGFKWDGWTNKFTTIPPNGVHDLYGNLGYVWPAAGPFRALTLQGIYHHFTSDRLSQTYGKEYDLLASAKLHGTTLSVRYADYRADAFASNTHKFWLQLDWSL